MSAKNTRLVHVCGTETFKPGDKPPKGLMDWWEWARVQHAAKLKQGWCPKHERWEFPQECPEPKRSKP